MGQDHISTVFTCNTDFLFQPKESSNSKFLFVLLEVWFCFVLFHFVLLLHILFLVLVCWGFFLFSIQFTNGDGMLLILIH